MKINEEETGDAPFLKRMAGSVYGAIGIAVVSDTT